MSEMKKIIFVYNAKSGFMHSVTDLFRKTANPNTYPCKLCSLTYSGAFMKKMWKQYVDGLGIETLFLHKDEFVKVYPDYKTTYPVVLLSSGKHLIRLISSADFSKLNDLTDLISVLNKRLSDVKK